MTSSLTKAAQDRTAAVKRAMSKTKKVIEKELRMNDDIYPRNSGRLSFAEVCRRAGVHPVTMYGPAHRSTTRVDILNWLERIRKPESTGVRGIRRNANDRAMEWKRKHDLVVSQFKRMYSIEIVQRDTKISALESENADLRRTIASIRATKGKVVGIKSER